MLVGLESMRIEQQSRQIVDQLKKEVLPNAKQTNFSDMVQQSGKSLLKDTLQQLIHKIDEQGKVLANKRTIDDLVAYKKLVKQFLQEANNGLELFEKHSLNHQKTYKIIRAVDEKLLEMNKEVLEKEDNGVKLLSVVGEVKGLLINLYM
jgi:uncharacterized protein